MVINFLSTYKIYNYVLTYTTDEVILIPPAPPIISWTSPFLSTIITGHIDDSGILPGAIKLAGDAGTPYEFTFPGVEKSSISSFMIMPVVKDRMRDPKLKCSFSLLM